MTPPPPPVRAVPVVNRNNPSEPKDDTPASTGSTPQGITPAGASQESGSGNSSRTDSDDDSSSQDVRPVVRQLTNAFENDVHLSDDSDNDSVDSDGFTHEERRTHAEAAAAHAALQRDKATGNTEETGSPLTNVNPLLREPKPEDPNDVQDIQQTPRPFGYERPNTPTEEQCLNLNCDKADPKCKSRWERCKEILGELNPIPHYRNWVNSFSKRPTKTAADNEEFHASY